jgi:hypothetical protein
VPCRARQITANFGSKWFQDRHKEFASSHSFRVPAFA